MEDEEPKPIAARSQSQAKLGDSSDGVKFDGFAVFSLKITFFVLFCFVFFIYFVCWFKITKLLYSVLCLSFLYCNLFYIFFNLATQKTASLVGYSLRKIKNVGLFVKRKTQVQALFSRKKPAGITFCFFEFLSVVFSNSMQQTILKDLPT
jgi:hypothetical protein